MNLVWLPKGVCMQCNLNNLSPYLFCLYEFLTCLILNVSSLFIISDMLKVLIHSTITDNLYIASCIYKEIMFFEMTFIHMIMLDWGVLFSVLGFKNLVCAQCLL